MLSHTKDLILILKLYVCLFIQIIIYQFHIEMAPGVYLCYFEKVECYVRVMSCNSYYNSLNIKI